MPTPPGFRHSEESKRKISEGQRRYYRMKVEKDPVPERVVKVADKKTCSGCGKTKIIGEFYIKRRKMKCGLVHAYPEARCKQCRRERFKENYEKLKAEGGAREKWERDSARRDPEKKRQYGREWAAAKRREEGAKLNGPWKKYRQGDGAKGRASGDETLPAGPLAEFLKQEVALRGRERVVQEIGSARRLYAFLHGEYETTKLHVVDLLLTRMGRPDMLLQLYPVEVERPLYGYFKP